MPKNCENISKTKLEPTGDFKRIEVQENFFGKLGKKLVKQKKNKYFSCETRLF